MDRRPGTLPRDGSGVSERVDGELRLVAVAVECQSNAMQWSDEGIVLGVRRHGEANAIAELMTRGHGRHLGLVRGGGGSRQKPVLQTGR